jgi:hypothetical protein
MHERTLLVTVDSLRDDHLQHMPATRSFLDEFHDRAFAACTATLGSFPSIIGGEYAAGGSLTPGTSVANEFSCRTVGITTNHLLSPRYGYGEGFDVFTSPHNDETTNTLKETLAKRLTIGSHPYRLASRLWGEIQNVRDSFVGVEKSFRPGDDVVAEFLDAVDPDDDWFGWLHLMEPHYPYDPDGASLNRARAQQLTRKVISGNGTEAEEERVRELYRQEVEELDERLATLWKAVPEDTRVVFCADHGEMLGEDGLWGHPGEPRPELLRIPFGTRNAPSVGEVVSHVDIPTILTGSEHGEGTFERETAFATYADMKAAMNAEHIATTDGVWTFDGEPAANPGLVRELDRFESSGVMKEDAVREDLEALGYV